jgi:hypothetical protein
MVTATIAFWNLDELSVVTGICGDSMGRTLNE